MGYAATAPLTVSGRFATSEALWRALRRVTAPASIGELHILSGAHPNAIQLRLTRWIRAGFVRRADVQPRRYEMLETAPAAPPTVNARGQRGPATTGQGRLWAAMRVLKGFDMPALVMAAQTSRRAAETYLNALQRSGHVVMVRRGNSQSGEWSLYRLALNSGPKAPKILRRDGGKIVHDPNEGTARDISPAAVSLREPREVNHVR